MTSKWRNWSPSGLFEDARNGLTSKEEIKHEIAVLNKDLELRPRKRERKSQRNHYHGDPAAPPIGG